MMPVNSDRRAFFKSSVFGVMTLGITPVVMSGVPSTDVQDDNLFYRYPAIGDQLVKEVVSASHGRFDAVKELVIRRPELAKASWDWGFGDYESSLGAASHMGRKDIAEFLMEYGARPNIFTYAMLGEIDVVRSMIQSTPGVQRTEGPHGISLLGHARSRLWDKNINSGDRVKAEAMIEFLESLGDADGEESKQLSRDEQEVYMGEFRWGPADDEVFVVERNQRQFLILKRKGTFGRVMKVVGEHSFSLFGASSVRIRFQVEKNKAVALTVHEPDPVVAAVRII